MKKKILLLILLTTVILSYGQNGSFRICGQEFSVYGLKGKSISEALEYAAKLHDDYQDFILTHLKTVSPSFSDTGNLKQMIYTKTNDFFSEKGFHYDPNKYSISFTQADFNSLPFEMNSYSQEARNILRRLEELVKGFEDNNESIFFDGIQQLKQMSLNISDEKEVFAVGIPVYVAENSIRYWKRKGQEWLDTFTDTDTEVTPNGENGPSNLLIAVFKKKCDIKLRKIGGADVAGGISGGYSGTTLGPGGAFAGAVLGSSVSSLGNLTNQVMDCLFNWWPF